MAASPLRGYPVGRRLFRHSNGARQCAVCRHHPSRRTRLVGAFHRCRYVSSDCVRSPRRFPAFSLGFVGSRRAAKLRGRRAGPKVALARAAGRPGSGGLPGGQAQASRAGGRIPPSGPDISHLLRCKVRLRLRIARSAEIPPMSPPAGPPGTWNVPAITTPAGWLSARDRPGPASLAGRLPGARANREPGGVAALSLSLALRKSSGDLRLIEVPNRGSRQFSAGYWPRSSR